MCRPKPNFVPRVSSLSGWPSGCPRRADTFAAAWRVVTTSQLPASRPRSTTATATRTTTSARTAIAPPRRAGQTESCPAGINRDDWPPALSVPSERSARWATSFWSMRAAERVPSLIRRQLAAELVRLRSPAPIRGLRRRRAVEIAQVALPVAAQQHEYMIGAEPVGSGHAGDESRTPTISGSLSSVPAHRSRVRARLSQVRWCLVGAAGVEPATTRL